MPPSAEERQILGMPAPESITTIEELLALPDDGLRHELQGAPATNDPRSSMASSPGH